MNIKKYTVVFAALFVCALLAGCAPEIIVNTTSDTYNLTAAELQKSFDGAEAPDGKSFLLIRIEGAKNSIEDMESNFFNYRNPMCQVSDGTSSVPCNSIAYVKEGDKVIGILAFEVPDDFGPEFSLIGETIGVTQVKL